MKVTELKAMIDDLVEMEERLNAKYSGKGFTLSEIEELSIHYTNQVNAFIRENYDITGSPVRVNFMVAGTSISVSFEQEPVLIEVEREREE